MRRRCQIEFWKVWGRHKDKVTNAWPRLNFWRKNVCKCSFWSNFEVEAALLKSQTHQVESKELYLVLAAGRAIATGAMATITYFVPLSHPSCMAFKLDTFAINIFLQ